MELEYYLGIDSTILRVMWSVESKVFYALIFREIDLKIQNFPFCLVHARIVTVKSSVNNVDSTTRDYYCSLFKGY